MLIIQENTGKLLQMIKSSIKDKIDKMVQFNMWPQKLKQTNLLVKR